MTRTMDTPRDRLPALIRNDFRNAVRDTGVEAPSERVMQAMQEVPRHLFVQRAFQESAYSNPCGSHPASFPVETPFCESLERKTRESHSLAIPDN